MIDFRHETFFELCQIKSYTKTAKLLHLTQPAVSQHIRYLETLYGGKLVEYRDKTLVPTPKGEKLYRYLATLRSDIKRLEETLKNTDNHTVPVHFGATLTIGEYLMPRILASILKAQPQRRISMIVENTDRLLLKLQEGNIDFALIEGYFDKSLYESKALGRENFIPICSPASPLAKSRVSFADLSGQNLIIREEGSGTREVFEQILKKHNYSLNSFMQIFEVGSMNVIKQLVAQDLGISFMYQKAAAAELRKGELAEFFIDGFSAGHEFNFVYLRNSFYEQQHLEWFWRIREEFPAE